MKNGLNGSKLIGFSVCVMVVLLLIGSNAAAQATLGTLEGILKDDQGSALPGVTLNLTNTETGYVYSAISRPDGRYIIGGIQPGKYKIEVSVSDFEKQTRLGLIFNVGSILKIDFVLKTATISKEITVTAPSPMVEVTKSDVSKVIDRSKIDNLPLVDRSFAALAMMKAGVTGEQSNAQPVGSEDFKVDGVSDKRVARNDIKTALPADAIEEFRVMTNQYAAEFGDASGMVWTVITRSGTNELRGRLSYFNKNEALGDVNYFTNHTGYEGAEIPKGQYTKPNFKYNLFGGVVGGPIIKDKLHFFVSYEGLRETDYVEINSPLVAKQTVNHPYNTDQLMVKLNYQLNKDHLFSFRYNLDKTHEENRGIGGLKTISCAFNYINTNKEYQANWTWYPSGNTMNEFRVLNSASDGSNNPNEPNTYSIVRPSGVFGKNATVPVVAQETRLQFVDNLSVFLNNHSLKFGIDFSNVQEKGWISVYNPGQYVFTTDAPFNAADFGTYPLYMIYNPTGKADMNAPYKDLGIFAQDTWKFNSQLTFNYGLRWNYYECKAVNLNHSDLHHLNPRFGFSWDPIGDGKTSIRGGIGTFTQNPQINIGLIAMLYQQFNIQLKYYPNYPDPNLTNPFFPIDLGQAIPFDTYSTVANMAPPTTTQMTLGAERQLAQDFSVGVDFVYSKGTHFTRVENFNPIIPGTGYIHTDPTKGNDFRFVDAGRTEYKAMYVTLSKRYSHGWSLDVAYTLSSSKSDVESEQTSAWSYAADAWARQFGYISYDARHRIAVTGIVDLPLGFQLTGLFSWNSPYPWNAIYATDVNLDGLSGDYVDYSRNSRRGFSYANLNLRISKFFTIDRFRLQLLIEAYNVFNKVNYGGIYPYIGSSLFGLPIAADSPRQLQLGVRLDF